MLLYGCTLESGWFVCAVRLSGYQVGECIPRINFITSNTGVLVRAENYTPLPLPDEVLSNIAEHPDPALRPAK